MINYTNPNCRLLESFCEDWPEPDFENEDGELDECGTVAVAQAEEDIDESVNKTENPSDNASSNASENKTLHEDTDDEAEETEEVAEEVEEEAEEESIDSDELIKAVEAVLHLDEEGNEVDDEFNAGIHAALDALNALVADDEETEEAPADAEEPVDEE